MGRIITVTPAGLMEIISDGTALLGVRSVSAVSGEYFRDGITDAAEKQLLEYFGGKEV